MLVHLVSWPGSPSLGLLETTGAPGGVALRLNPLFTRYSMDKGYDRCGVRVPLHRD